MVKWSVSGCQSRELPESRTGVLKQEEINDTKPLTLLNRLCIVFMFFWNRHNCTEEMLWNAILFKILLSKLIKSVKFLEVFFVVVLLGDHRVALIPLTMA